MLILPGAVASTSINLSEIGQATSSAPPACGSSSLSPTVSHKNLPLSDIVLERAAMVMNVPAVAIGKPVTELIDEISLIRFTMKGCTPAEAFDHARAVLKAFQTALDTLRDDEIQRRQHSTTDAIAQYGESVRAICIQRITQSVFPVPLMDRLFLRRPFVNHHSEHVGSSDPESCAEFYGLSPPASGDRRGITNAALQCDSRHSMALQHFGGI